MTVRLLCSPLLLLYVMLVVEPAAAEGLGGGGPQASVDGALESQLGIDIESGHARESLARGSFEAVTVPEKFTFFPMGGTLYGDLNTINFVDLDATAGILDWDCTDYTYDGHNGIDVIVRTFGEQVIGVPIFAALDGEVVLTHDGEPDMNTSCVGIPNYVVINHADGRSTSYLHLKTGSVQVSVGQQVKAGEQIGLVGSSGCSTYPHLHFQATDNSVVFEPYAGTCRSGDSEWTDQTPIERDYYVLDLNITGVDISTQPELPFDKDRTGTFVRGIRTIYFWTMLMAQPAGDTWRVRIRNPSNTVVFDSGTIGFGNIFLRWSWWWWGYTVNLNQTGTWRLELDLDGGALSTSAPFDVVATVGGVVNRPPAAVSVAIEPSTPIHSDVLICRVDADLLFDDPDYDIVRYRYKWVSNGQTLRDVTTASHSDVLPHHTAATGLTTCTVTPSDGTDSAASVQAAVFLPSEVPSGGAGIVGLVVALAAGGGVALLRYRAT